MFFKNKINIFIKLAIPVALLFIFAGAETRADAPPLPVSKTQALNSLQERLEQEKDQKSTLQKKLKSTKKKLKQTKADLLKIAKSVQRNEAALQNLETQITALSAERKGIEQRLEQDYGSIANLILALERMSRIPPEALIIRPGAPLQTAQTAMLLKSVLPSVHKRTESLSADLKRLQTIRTTLDQNRQDTLKTKTQLKTKKMAMADLLNTREKLYKKTNSNYAQSARNVKRIAKEARSLQDLLTKLAENERSKSRAAEAKKAQSSNRKTKTVSFFMPGHGKAQTPVSGIITTGYGETDSIGATSRGLTIQGRSAALVVAPMGGVVRFAGTFKNYGHMVILEHKKGYHSLLAGFERIDTVVGQTVAAGEPMGQLPSSSSRGTNPALYYELRYKGQPVNPSAKISDLKS